MWYVGIDLSWKTSVIAMVSDSGEEVRPRGLPNHAPAAIVAFLANYRPFRAVIEASGSYRWLYDLLAPHGEVVLAHPHRLKAIWSARAKTDKLDAKVLSELLRAGLIPMSYAPPPEYQMLRDLTRARAKLVRACTVAQNDLHALLARVNVQAPLKYSFGPRGRQWLSALPLDPVLAAVRDERLARIRHFHDATARLDEQIAAVAPRFPQAEALMSLRGFGLYSALLVIAEFGEPWRFRRAAQAAAYAGLTPRVYQSGAHEYRGRIAKEGSSWLRWILVEAAMKITREDEPLRNFYERVRRRCGKFPARVAVARKLAEICWKRLRAWHAAHPAA